MDGDVEGDHLVSEPPPEATIRFVPDRRYTVAAAVGALAAVIALLIADDGPSRLFAALVLAVTASYVIGDLVFSPRLEVGPSGLVIRSPMTRARLSWAEIESIRADELIRHGLRSTALEIDAGPVLAVLSRRALGTEPERAAALVLALRPR